MPSELEKVPLIYSLIHSLTSYDVIAMLKRSKKEGNSMTEYYLVIGAFVAICVAAVVYVLLNPKKSFSQMQVIDES